MKPFFESQPVLFLIQGFYFQKEPKMFLNLIDKKLFDTQYFLFLALSYCIILYSTLLQRDLAFKQWILRKGMTEHFC